MANQERSELHRAFDDLNEGLRALLGMARSHPQIVDELLDRRTEDPQPRGTYRARGLPAPRAVGKGIARRAKRFGRPGKKHLSLVK